MSTQTLPARPPLSSEAQAASPRERSHPIELLALCLVLLLCVALRVYHLGAASLWSDEIFSRYYADVFGMRFLLTEGLSKEPTPPTYYLLLRGWIGLWGDSEAALRSLSVVASVLCLPVTWLLGREVAGRRAAFAATALFALCPMSVYFAQETRVYAVFMLAAATTLWAAALWQRSARPAKATLLYAVCATLCLYLHATGVLFVLACAGAVWLSLLLQRAGGRSALLRWTALNAFVILLGVPYFLHTLSASHSGGLDWMPRAGLHQVVYCTAQLLSGVLTPYPWPGLLLALAVMAALGVSLWMHRLPRAALVTLLGVPCLYLALVLAVSIERPILLPRILAWMAVPLCVFAGRQVLAPGRTRVAVALSLLAAFGAGLFFQVATPGSNKEPWRAITDSFGPQLQQADLVVLSPVSDPMVLRYYAPRLRNVRLWDASLRPSIMNEAAERLHIQPITEAQIQQTITSRHSVWIVAHSFDLARVNALRGRVPSTFYREWYCGKAPCVAVAGWQPQP